MSKKSYLILITFCILSLLFGSAGSVAQAAPGSPPEQSPDRPAIVEETPFDPDAPLVAVGKPGLTMRYTDSIGTLEHPYLADNTHLNFPWGIGAIDNNLWIAEFFGRRALKFTNQGTLLATINPNPGFEFIQGHTLVEAADVDTDASGNVWIVDSGAGYVLKFNSSGTFVGQLGRAYINGTQNDRFDVPGGIAFDSQGNIYVSDGSISSMTSGNHRIQVFNSGGTYQRTIGVTGESGTGNDHFTSPAHIFIDANNRLFVADMGNNRVQIFDVSDPGNPTYLQTLSGLNRPSGVTANATNIFVADRYNHRVQVFDGTTYALVGTIGTQGAGNNQFQYPSDVDVDDAGHLFVADFGNTRVQELNATSPYAFVRTFGTTGKPYLTDGSHFFSPRGLATDAQGNLYIVETSGQRMVKLNPSKQFVWAIGEAGVLGIESGGSHFNYPDDVAIDSKGQLFVADTWNHRIQVYGTDGTFIQTIGGFGTANRRFNCPKGVAVGPNDYVYIADTCNHRVQILDNQFAFVNSLGVTGVEGSDNSHFSNPKDVAVDAAGNIYVADSDNQRIQVFNSNRVYVRTIGVTGQAGTDFGHFNGPDMVAFDKQGHLYVSDSVNNRVQVFDAAGAYLTTIAGGSGNLSGDMRGAYGVAFDSSNNLYIADTGNHRIQKFAFGVPGWQQVNINAFGDLPNGSISALESFGGKLFAGTQNANGAQIWRMANPGEWARVAIAGTAGFGNLNTTSVNDFLTFKTRLYAGVTNKVNGGAIYRSTTGDTWAPITLPGLDINNGAVYRLAEFNNSIFAATGYYTYTHGAEIWTSRTGDSGDWLKVAENGFDSSYNRVIESLVGFNGYLYAGTYNRKTGGGAEVWRSANGAEGTWVKVNTSGFGNTGNFEVSALVPFKNYLYALTSHAPGAAAQLWRCQTCNTASDWKQVTLGSLDPQSVGPGNMMVFADQLYLVIGNPVAGFEVRRSSDGATWSTVGSGGLGDANNKSIYYYLDPMRVLNNPNYAQTFSLAVHSNGLYLGTMNAASGGEIWSNVVTTSLQHIYLPLSMGKPQ